MDSYIGHEKNKQQKKKSDCITIKNFFAKDIIEKLEKRFLIIYTIIQWGIQSYKAFIMKM